MKLLSILNLSNRDKPGADSGVIFQQLLLTRLVKHGWDCAVASPIPLHITGVRDIFLEVGESKYDVRFRFSWDEVVRIVSAQRPDVILVNQVELTSHFRALLVTIGVNARLLTYCHYWPIYEITAANRISWDDSLNHCGLAEIILLRILDAALTCDAFFVTSEFSKNLLLSAAQRYNVRVQAPKIHILPCPADPELLSPGRRRFRTGNTVLYNHRLYRQYGTEFLIEIIKEFARSEVRFVITDFFGSRSSARIGLDTHVERYRAELRRMKNVTIRDDGDSRSVYKNEILASADVGLGPFRKNANWSMSAVDCLGLGVPVVCPNCASFPEFTPNALLFDTKDKAVALLRRLLSDSSFWKECSLASQQKVARFSADRTATRFATVVQSLQ